MNGGYRRYGAVRTLAVLISGTVLAGCAGPSTRVLPRGEAPSKAFQEEIPLLEAANPVYIQESLRCLASEPRPSGSIGEIRAVEYMEKMLSGYGYEVERQSYTYETDGGMAEGCNLSGLRTSANQDGDILLIGTWHDTVSISPGAGKNGSGAAMFLEIARLLSALPTDTELRFVSFSGHEDGLMGVRHYVSRLSEREKQRIIGAVMLKPSGCQAGGELVIGTADGRGTMVGNMLREASGYEYSQMWSYQAAPGGENSVFMREEIPAVSIGQQFGSYEADTPLDLSSSVDAEALAQAAETVCSVAAEIMDARTPSMMAKSHSYNDRNYSFVQTKDTPSWFGETIETVQAGTGRTGMHLTVNMDSDGKTIEKYQFRMKWFGADQLITTNYYFTDGKLERIVPEAWEAGISFEEMKGLLEGFYGSSVGENKGASGIEYDWKDPEGGRFFALIPEEDRYLLEIREYTPDLAVLETRNGDGSLQEALKADSRCDACMELIAKVLPEMTGLEKITFFTDGAGGKSSYLTVMEHSTDREGEETAGWELGLDPANVLYQSGGWRDYTETVKKLTGFYGEILAKTKPELEKAYTSLQKDGASPDFSTAFTMFVLTDQPDETPGDWKEEVRFFYQSDECVDYRSQVRQNLKIQTEERAVTE